MEVYNLEQEFKIVLSKVQNELSEDSRLLMIGLFSYNPFTLIDRIYKEIKEL